MGKACDLTGGMFTPNVLYGVLQHLFLNHLFSTLLITLFTFALIKCYVRIIFNFFFSFFFFIKPLLEVFLLFVCICN